MPHSGIGMRLCVALCKIHSSIWVHWLFNTNPWWITCIISRIRAVKQLKIHAPIHTHINFIRKFNESTYRSNLLREVRLYTGAQRFCADVCIPINFWCCNFHNNLLSHPSKNELARSCKSLARIFHARLA